MNGGGENATGETQRAKRRTRKNEALRRKERRSPQPDTYDSRGRPVRTASTVFAKDFPVFSYLCTMRFRLTERAPMLPVTMALAAGIAVASWRMPPVWLSAAGVAACAAAAVASLRTGRLTASGAIVMAAVFLGATLTSIKLQTTAQGGEYGIYEIVIGRIARGQTEARIISHRDESGVWHRQRGRLRIYADTSLHIAAGQRIVCRGRIRPYAGRGYGAMMRLRGYAGSLYLGRDAVLQADHGGRMPDATGSLHRRAVAKIGSLPLQNDNMAVAMAVGTGNTSLLERSRRAEYSRAGTAHLLALSGLHVGIVYLLVNLLLRWLPLLAYGHIIRNTAAVVLLWLYVLSTGMPPSAVRAALMFSMLQLSQALSADYSPLNALACAAFISLCLDPGLLFDAGFRLSYIAVAAIILFAPPLCRRLHISRRDVRNGYTRASIAAVNRLAEIFVVGFVATAATAPMVSHLFGVIPLAGILTAPAAITAAAVTVALTAVWIALPLGFATAAFGRAVDLAAGAMNAVSEWLASCQWAALDVRLNGMETAVCYAVAIATACLLAAVGNDNRQTRNIRIG